MLSKFHDEEFDIIAYRISKLLLSEKKPVTVEHICQKLNDIDKHLLNKVIDRYQNHFQVLQQPLVKLVTKIDICKTHCCKNRTCPGIEPLCTGLHVCKYFMLSGKCQFEQQCSFGHDLKTDHNMKVLQQNLLADVTVDDLKFLLACAENRTSLTVPRICKFYNVSKDKCRHTEKGSVCPDIHICKHYVLDTCKFNKNCHRSHNILGYGNNSEILCKHGIDVNRPEAEIIEDLRKALSENSIERSARRSTDIDSNILTNIKAESVASTSFEKVSEIDSTHSLGLEDVKSVVLKKEESFTEETLCEEVDVANLRVDLSVDSVQFRYLSEITAIEKRNKSRKNTQDMYERSSLADVTLDNFEGNATIIAYCTGCDGNVHPFYLYGDNCKDGVYVKSNKLEKGKSVKLQGVYVCTPKIIDYQTSIAGTISSLGLQGISDTQKCDEKAVDKQCVYLKVVVIIEESSRKLSVTSTPLQNKKHSKQKDGQSDHVSSGQKRASFDYNQSNDDKRRRVSIANSKGDAQPGVFQRFYSRQDTEHPWGNFIDTSGYQESALTWKAQGEALHSVCMICYLGGCATGFRVGTNNIMTAAHVYDFILKSELGRVGGSEGNALKNPNVFAAFDYLKEGELQEKKKFHFKQKIHFINHELDTVVLELEEHPDGNPMPPPFEFFQQPDFTKEFFFIGHSEGKPLAVNRVDKIVDMGCEGAKQDIINIRNLSLRHTVSPQYPSGREYELEPFLTLENQHRYLFHCKFTQGASGSPGLVFLNDGRKVVVSMLLCGYPVWYYDPDMEEFRTGWSRDCQCVEQGVNLLSVHAFMSKENPKLCKDIFGS